VRHIPDGVLRRLDDEPLAVPDRVSEHLAVCDRCSDRRDDIANDTERATQLFSAPPAVADVDLAWARIRRDLERRSDAAASRPSPRVVARRARLPHVSLRAGLAIGAVGVALAGTAAAASLTTIFAPTHVAPVTVSPKDLRAVAALAGLGNGQALGGFTAPNGSTAFRFGTLTWSSGAARPVNSLARAATLAGFPVTLPAHLPAGVGAVQQYVVQPRVRAVVTFNSRAAGLAGTSVTIDAGPAVLAEYSGAGGVTTLAVTAIRRPTAQSSGASISQIKAFLLAQPGLPPELAQEIRLLGNSSTTLPVPVPSGAAVRSVHVNGSPGVLVADGSNVAAGVVWEDGRGLLHAVVGIVDSQDALNVAEQLG
jgi:hypothetical protein